MFIQLIILFVCALVLYRNFTKDDEDPKKKLPPGPKPYPILGNLVQLAKKKGLPPYKILREFSKEYGHIMSLQYGATYQVIFDDYDAVKDMLTSDLWADRYVDGWILERSFGKELGIFFGNGESWKEIRRFSLRTLRDFGFGKQKSQEMFIEEELEHLMKRMEEMIKQDGNTIPMKKFFSVSALNIIWSLIAGKRFSYDDARLQTLVELMSSIVRLLAVGEDIIAAYPILRHVLPRFTKRGRERRKFLQDIHSLFKGILAERRASGEYKVEERDFIDVFMNEIDLHAKEHPETNYFTDEQFLVLALDFFLAGTETTSSTMEFAFLYMLLYPEVQKKVQEEIDRVVDRDTMPSTLDRVRMPYTEAVLMEIHRMATVVPMYSRASTQDQYVNGYFIAKSFHHLRRGSLATAGTMPTIIIESGQKIKNRILDLFLAAFQQYQFCSTTTPLFWKIIRLRKLEQIMIDGIVPAVAKDPDLNTIFSQGTMGIVSLYSSNYSEETWGDPYVFRPERFLDEKMNIINAGKIMPFGLGKRICAGEVLAKANLFKFFTSFLQRYTFSKSLDHPEPATEGVLGTVMSPQPFWAVVTAR